MQLRRDRLAPPTLAVLAMAILTAGGPITANADDPEPDQVPSCTTDEGAPLDCDGIYVTQDDGGGLLPADIITCNNDTRAYPNAQGAGVMRAVSTTSCSRSMPEVWVNVCVQHKTGFWWWQWSGDDHCGGWRVAYNASAKADGYYYWAGRGTFRSHAYHRVVPPAGYPCNPPSCRWESYSGSIDQ